MNTQTKAMKLARLAINNLIASSHATDPQPWRDARQDAADALTAIDKALAEQPAQQEPVASVRTWHKNSDQHAELDDWGLALALLPDGKHDLYTSPQAQRKPLTLQELEAAWNAQADHMNTWNELGLDEIVAWAQAAHNIKEKS